MFHTGLIILLTLLLPPAARAGGEKPYYFIVVQNGPYNAADGAGQLAGSYKALSEMVKLADAQNARLTLLFAPQYAVYIASDPARLAELEGWKKTGHEIGAYHRGPETGAWDGYSDLPAAAALARLAPGIKTGCLPDKADKKFLAAAPPYEICGGAGARGKEGAAAGVNDFVAVAGGEPSKKHLSSFQPSDKPGIEAAEKEFSGLSSGVYGASFTSSQSQFGAFYVWLSFLKGLDPQGLRSRTVSAVVEGGLLPEKKLVAAPALGGKEKQSAGPRPETPKAELPRLKPVPSLYGEVGKQMYGPRTPIKKMQRRGRCGDGVCDAFERAHPGRCARDCGK